MDRFSPISRNATVKDPINVLICTDADGVGVNLQDANVVVNYDPANSANTLFQRAGRIIRFTIDAHRKIYFYTFKPILNHPLPSKACDKIETVFTNMTKHHDRSKNIFGLSLLPSSDETVLDLNDIKQETDFNGSFNLTNDSVLTDPLFRHTAIYDQYRESVAGIRDGFYCSMVYKESQPRIVMLLQDGVKKHVLLYNLATKAFEHTDNYVPILNLITCKPTQQNAPIDFESIERATLLVVKKWRSQQKITGETSIICGLYLAPKSKRTFARELLRAFIQVRKKRSEKTRKKKPKK